jgi:hypothetical protein
MLPGVAHLVGPEFGPPTTSNNRIPKITEPPRWNVVASFQTSAAVEVSVAVEVAASTECGGQLWVASS